MTGKPTLEHARQQHLTSLTPYWFASLLYTPLHTRPNILALLREWSFHRIPADPSSPRGTSAFPGRDRPHATPRLLAGTGPLDLSARVRATTPGESAPPPPPYQPLPVLGHVAVYTLNLILLRTYLSQQDWTLDEPALNAGDRPWDRLTALWRSWFTPESLGTLAIQFTATRSTDHLTLEPTRSKLNATSNTHLETAYNTAIAMADDLIAADLACNWPRSPVFLRIASTPFSTEFRRRQTRWLCARSPCGHAYTVVPARKTWSLSIAN